MIRIYSLKVERELNERERQQALNIITPERKARALRFRRLEDQNKGLATGVLERYALWKSFGILELEGQICKGEQGKPYLAAYPEVHYNISHAGEWIVCATGIHDMGIDVEQTKKYSERLVRRFFHSQETEDILSQPESRRGDVFAEYWTMKESFMKLCGTGFQLPFSSFTTQRETGLVHILPSIKEEMLVRLRKQGILENRTPVCQFIELDMGYKCAVCTIEACTIVQIPVALEMCIEEIISSHRQSE